MADISPSRFLKMGATRDLSDNLNDISAIYGDLSASRGHEP